MPSLFIVPFIIIIRMFKVPNIFRQKDNNNIIISYGVEKIKYDLVISSGIYIVSHYKYKRGNWNNF